MPDITNQVLGTNPQVPVTQSSPQPSTMVTGRQTVFGLNYDGSPDTGDRANSGFFTNPATGTPYNSHDPNQAFASIPFSVFRSAIGDPYDPKIQKAVSNGAYHVRATVNGKTADLPLGDLGPAAWTGNALDLSGGAAQAFGLKDNSKAAYQIVGPDNKPVQFDLSKTGIDPNAPIESGKTRGAYANDALQRYMKWTNQFAPGVKVMLPEDVQKADSFVQQGGHMYDLPYADQLGYSLAKDPSFLTKPENFPIFKSQIWDKRPDIGQQVNSFVGGFPDMVRGAIGSAIAYGKSATNAANFAATNAQGLGQGTSDAVDMLDGMVTNISNFPKSMAAMLPGVSQASKDAADLQNAKDAQALMARNFQRSSWAENMQNTAASAYKAIGFTKYGADVQSAQPNPSAVDASAAISNPTNYIGLGVGLLSKVIKPLLFERAIDATLEASRIDSTATALKATVPGSLPIVPGASNAAATAMSDSDRINTAIAANLQDNSALSTALQGAGKVSQGVGETAKAVTDLPGQALSRLGPLGETMAGAALERVLPQVAPVLAGLKSATMGIPAGKLMSLAGKELSYGETSIPYFQRMAQQTQGLTRATMSALDNPAVYTLGSATKGAVSGAAVGGLIGATASPLPNLQTAMSGATQGALFGAVGGGLGQWMKYGTEGQFMLEAAGDLKRYKDTATTTELQGFNRLSPTDQGKLATFTQHFPGAQLEFQHDPAGPSGFHEITPEGKSRIMLNTASATPMDGVMAHEFAHATVSNNNFSAITDSILGNPDKGIAAQYSPQEWAGIKQQYIDKLQSSGRPTSHLSDKDIALETYAEQGVDYLKSGKGFVDAKSAFNPAISANPGALKNVMAKLGYSFDEQGNNVKGTNLFSNATQNNRLDGLQKAYMTEKQKYDLDYKEDRVDRLITPEDLKNPKILDKLKAVPEIARDAKGNVMKDKDGNILRVSTSAVDKQYRMLGEDIKKQVNHLPQDMRDAIGHTVEGNGTEHFNYLPDQVVQSLRDSNKYNPEQLNNLDKINKLRQDPSQHGTEAKIFYQAATSKGKYGSIAGADRFWTPQGFTVTTKGNLNIKMADYSKMVNNYLKMQNKPDVRAAGFTSPADFQNHASQYFENHQQGLPGYTGLDNNPKIALAKRDAINATLGLDTTTWRGNNPLAAQLPNRSGSFIIDGRLDRMNNVTPTDTIRPPVNYGLVNKNYLPNQSATK